MVPATPDDSSAPRPVLPLHCVAEAGYAAWLDQQPPAASAWLAAVGFKPEKARWTAIPDGSGSIQMVVAGLGKGVADAIGWYWLGASLADRLPPANYRLEPCPSQPLLTSFVAGWHYAGYRFDRYRKSDTKAPRPQLQWPQGVDQRLVAGAAAASNLARDLINTPANEMGPPELEREARQLAERAGGELAVIAGDALRTGFPLIAAVGQGSPRSPRLLDLRFRRAGAPRVTLVGKGVCFDTGGLDMKPSAGMALMKKDMGGAACALATAQLLQALQVPVDLRVLIPAVENSVDGAAQRPGDVWRSRKGISVEITNTDAEGRLVVADALAYASEEQPDLLVDFATLTGAARVALGPELPPVYGGDPALLGQLQALGQVHADPLWPMPLWDPYDEDLSSRIADINNAPSGGMAGSITAALFLRRFVADPSRWIHLDIYGWNARERPGRPTGAEPQGVRAVVALLQQRYS